MPGSSVHLREIKLALYGFIERNITRLRITNLQFPFESGDDLNKDLTWFTRSKHMADARAYAEIGEYSDYFQFCLNECFYSMQIADGSLVQLYMHADSDGKLADGNLAFIPTPGNGFDYMRFDFAPSDARHYRHNRYHGHFGFAAKNMRVSLYQFPWPDEFLTFLAHLMSDEKGRQLIGSDFQVDAKVTRFHHDRHLSNLDVCHERYNHCLRFSLDTSGGASTPDLQCERWSEEIV